MSRSSSQSGNVFILILVAVALFAALSWVFTQNSRQSSGALTAEQAKMGAQELIAFGNTLANAAQKLRLRGCADTQFDFSNTVWKSVDENLLYPPGHNPHAPATGCGIFKIDEGGVNPYTFEQYSDLSIVIPSGTKWGHGTIYAARIEGVGDPNKEEIYLQIPPIKKDVCLAVNEIAGVPNPSGNPPVGTSAITHYDGAFEETTVLDSADDAFKGAMNFCYFSASRYRFVQVIYAR